ncbi:helix-turn-helix domain-containing protein [Sinimarinibacterium flocculans]|uniref:helix-turn-helix domain-containing protein n=1 Tax=Sinimarinibacterium flocculans TaxID=985250 RepID=UPI00248F48F8|nr:helix-turn-helix transcriptional regulator [Sinimarinibacterium flocculans]
MADIQAFFRSEIARLSKKVVKQYVSPLHAAISAQRRDLAELRRQVTNLERTSKKLGKNSTKPLRVDEASETKLRFRAQGFRNHRERLGISAEEAGTLIGVSGQTVYNWEHGKATPRNSQLPAIAALRELGKREARRKLDELSA